MHNLHGTNYNYIVAVKNVNGFDVVFGILLYGDKPVYQTSAWSEYGVIQQIRKELNKRLELFGETKAA